MTNTNNPTVLITPLKPALIQGLAQKLPVLVRIQAPDLDPTQQKVRRPYHLSLVIDRSGSMSGEPLARGGSLRRAHRRPPGGRPTSPRWSSSTTASRRSPRRSRWATGRRCTPPWRRSRPAAPPTCTAAGRPGRTPCCRRPRKPPSPASSCCPTATPTSAKPPTPRDRRALRRGRRAAA